MLRYLSYAYGFGMMKFGVIFLEWIALRCYKLKKFRVDVEFMINNGTRQTAKTKKLNILTKLAWLFFIPISVVISGYGVVNQVNLFIYNNQAIPPWAIGIINIRKIYYFHMLRQPKLYLL